MMTRVGVGVVGFGTVGTGVVKILLDNAGLIRRRVGVPSELVEVSPGTFRPAVEDGSFVRVQRSDDGSEWEARTKALARHELVKS